jgi:hypothetical protein
VRTGYKTEAELGTAVQGWLSQSGWDVYPEVTGGGGEARADLVAVCGPLLWVVECKMHFGLEVLGQAHRWRDRAHYVSIAVPQMPRDSGFARLAAVTFGIGIIVATPPRWKGERLGWSVRAPDFNRRASVTGLRSLLHVGQKAFTAGAQSGFYTPYQGTCQALRELLDQHPEGLPVKEAIAGIEHHYRKDGTARAALMKWARWGRVPGVVLVEGNPPRFVRKDAT